ncbi:DUF2304 domain-containing protein [Candidatus Berkelbacteria bacterium]|nr:DUF2304 domain-containing protein [Candidatus Berkelbacteria bacterium]MBI2588188.1 DUF2304 domain-containing protein [Candidatus Berkelbacteria bacterium]
MIFIARIFAAFLAALVITKTYLEFRKGREPWPVFLFWISTWLLIVFIALFPGMIDWALSLLGGERTGLGTVFGMALVFLFYVIYRIYVKAERIEKTLYRLAQDWSLNNSNHPNRSRPK